MTKKEFRNSQEYKELVEKIKGYSKGFEFTLPYYKMTQGQKNAIQIVVDDCIKKRILDTISIGLRLDGTITEETFIRL
ncbi:UNVERIFIED_CONTAM: hypothetical protein MUK63_06785 [Blautia caecimuris]